jgi:hypothetical protein
MLVNWGKKEGAYINVYFDPDDIVKMEKSEWIFEYLESQAGEIWISTYSELCEFLAELEDVAGKNPLKLETD